MKITNWSERVQGIQSLDSSREIKFSTSNLNRIIELTKVKKGMKVLEVGCGPGTLTRKLVEYFDNDISVTGLDMDEHFIKYCKEQAKLKGIKNATYEAGDALALPFEDNSFDICTSHTVIEHVPNREFLLEQYRVCKPNGYVSIMNVRGELALNSRYNDHQTPREVELFDRIGSVISQAEQGFSVGKYFDQPENILRLFEEIGFRDIQFDVISYVSCIDDSRHTLDFRKKMIESKRNTNLEFINMGLNIKANALTIDEEKELRELINKRFDDRLSQINEGQNAWDFSVSPMIIITGRKN